MSAKSFPLFTRRLDSSCPKPVSQKSKNETIFVGVILHAGNRIREFEFVDVRVVVRYTWRYFFPRGTSERFRIGDRMRGPGGHAEASSYKCSLGIYDVDRRPRLQGAHQALPRDTFQMLIKCMGARLVKLVALWGEVLDAPPPEGARAVRPGAVANPLKLFVRRPRMPPTDPPGPPRQNSGGRAPVTEPK